MLRQNLYTVIILVVFLNVSFGQNTGHPRIYISEESKDNFIQSLEAAPWKKNFVTKKKEKVAKYLSLVKDNPEWMVSRLQMNWKTKHDEVFLRGGDFSHSSGEAPVPTVRFSGTRDWATEYRRPKIDDVEPYFDDPRGFYLQHKISGEAKWIHPSETGHIIEKLNEQVMSIAEDAAFLYWYTNEEKYAELAAPVFLAYIQGMYHRKAPTDLENGNQQYISGLATFEVIHERILVSLVTIYDFMHDYFKVNGHSLEESTAVLQRWGDQIIKNGIPDNNWNLFQARFLTYIAIVLEDNETYANGKGKEYFLDHTFSTSTDRQLAISESLLEYDQNTAIWPESASYSVHVITTLLRIITLLDNSTHNNELANYAIIDKAALASFQYLFPNGYTVGFGDSNHKPLPSENFELLLSNYSKYEKHAKAELMSGLLNQMVEDGLYERHAKDYFQLFFYVDVLDKNASTKDSNLFDQLVTPTFYAPNVSMFNQRMGSGDEAIMASVVGSFGNHAHANGVSLELYANNYALAPDMGKGPSYWHETHRQFYSRFPAHNTVVVDRKSDYSAMRSKHPYTLDSCFPRPGTAPLFDKISYSQVSFWEPKSNSEQSRFTALVKSHLPSERGYVVDLFRSMKQNGGEQLHEYIYHNLGHSLMLSDKKGNPLTLSPSQELKSKNDELKGYDFFSDEHKVQTNDDVLAQFRINNNDGQDNVMKTWIKGMEDQTIFKVNSPKSNAISSGTAPVSLINAPLPTFILSRCTEAWTNPFAVVFNPFFEGGENPIENVSYSSLSEYPTAQIIDVELSDKISFDQFVVNASENDIVRNDSFYQKGLLSVRRYSKEDEGFSFLFLSGMRSFKRDGWEIISTGKSFSCSIEKSDSGFEVFSDKPVKITLPYPTDAILPTVNFFKNGKILTTRIARRSRHNDEQILFYIDQEYEKVELNIQQIKNKNDKN